MHSDLSLFAEAIFAMTKKRLLWAGLLVLADGIGGMVGCHLCLTRRVWSGLLVVVGSLIAGTFGMALFFSVYNISTWAWLILGGVAALIVVTRR